MGGLLFYNEIKGKGSAMLFDRKDLIQELMWENQFGVTYVYKFTTEEGNIFTWKTGKSLRVSEGAITLKGTIKAHNEFRGAKETELTRCKVM